MRLLRNVCYCGTQDPHLPHLCPGWTPQAAGSSQYTNVKLELHQEQNIVAQYLNEPAVHCSISFQPLDLCIPSRTLLMSEQMILHQADMLAAKVSQPIR